MVLLAIRYNVKLYQQYNDSIRNRWYSDIIEAAEVKHRQTAKKKRGDLDPERKGTVCGRILRRI